MDRIKDYSDLSLKISDWMKNYANDNNIKGFVVGVSGGIDSSVVSTLAAKTNLPTYALGMPIHQKNEQKNLSNVHLNWLKTNFSNVIVEEFDLTNVFESFKSVMGKFSTDNHALANTRSRIRMVTLYQVATSTGSIVAGTGNKVEDYGVGFYTKYGDGGVDIAPIADLYKTEVWQLGRHLGVDQRIIDAAPTDGLWDDGRTDENQLGATYLDLEEAMEYGTGPAVEILKKFNTANQHKMNPIPTFTL